MTSRTDYLLLTTYYLLLTTYYLLLTTYYLLLTAYYLPLTTYSLLLTTYYLLLTTYYLLLTTYYLLLTLPGRNPHCMGNLATQLISMVVMRHVFNKLQEVATPVLLNKWRVYTEEREMRRAGFVPRPMTFYEQQARRIG